jgi:hypothetical protein
MSKYDFLGVPLNKNFISEKAFDLSSFSANVSDENTVNNIFYLKTIVSNTIKYKMLYPLNIYWIDELNFVIPYNFTSTIIDTINTGKKIIIIRVNIIDKILHANLLLIDTINKRIIRFEPQGGVSKEKMSIFDKKIENTLKTDSFFVHYTYFEPKDYEPISGFQSLSQETNTDITRKGDINGFCVAWCLWFVELYIQNIINNLDTETKFKGFFPKVIKKLINSNYLIPEYIRNYANYMHNKLVILLTKNNFPYTNLYYERYSDNELFMIYSYVNNSLSKL